MPYVNIDFYGVYDSEGQPLPLAAAIIAAGKFPPAQRLKYRNPTHSDFLDKVTAFKDGTVLGCSARIRMKGIPGHFKASAYSLGDLNLPANDGVSEEVYFVVDDALQVVALQRNGHFRSTQVEALLRDLTGLNLTLEPKVRPDVWKRLQKMDHISSVEVRLKDPSFHPDLSDSLPSVGKLIDETSKVAELRSIEIKFNMRRGYKGAQDTSVLKRLLSGFRNSDNVETLRAKGYRNDSTKTEPIDFLRDRIVSGGEVEYSDEKRLNSKQCQQLIRSVLDSSRDFLTTLVIPPK